MVLEQESRIKGDIFLLRLLRYPLQRIAKEHYKAFHIVIKRILSSYLLQTRSVYKNLIVSRQIARKQTYFPLWMSDSFNVFQKRKEKQLSRETSYRLEESSFLSAGFIPI